MRNFTDLRITDVVEMVCLLAVSGSLRQTSSNSILLRATERLCPDGVLVRHYEGIGELPHFNPDLLEDPPETVIALWSIIGQADGLLFSCPEYARGIPGSFKNMLDWLVSSEEFPGKPVALFNASPRASHAQAALRLVLDTMSARIIEEASMTVNLLSSRLSAESIAADPVLGPMIGTALDAFKRRLDNQNL
ncbi:NAD(P)H-dependent oxidoreductase [Pseudomonas serboccidentalis]|uniref:NAD(P)H-dependent oxidoreductase n=1 Tax=Pseudomonas serboccidentalis TaxID=2964670 RepID=A0ABY7Z3V8_9PSED|nr:NADPH-dependent FMN reductase [Pseudomonas serboccidentalis]WDR34304.1 NAD(P)H-dependent oxidoreductase [Pseudomonas serboccidentalis]